ncbi:hypothetical protein FHS51_001733 [Sphingobium wenxiniae]|uniref:Uncharacterized protein n=1 Tax=Sphingobium wenxiniae (strain DSM 21828 / CGMCC 1.7748 / JZ-1) TaxID=595605 RepID=A0A562KD06_SPHWJ|nr:hypothetical protein [Sphingobium wenxiniae]MBB6191506.1 hypothetical protein [Sphingobium wenxiniae]TWH93204.1 hypothetical protein IQ35_02111 [Sphingobium wenxiniae]
MDEITRRLMMAAAAKGKAEYINSFSVINGSMLSSSATFAIPPGAQVGDLILVFVAATGSSISMTPPAGWTVLTAWSGSGPCGCVFYRERQAGDSNGYMSVPFSVSAYANTFSQCWRNAKIGAYGAFARASTPVVASGITMGSDGFLLHFVAAYASPTFTPEGSMSIRYASSSPAPSIANFYAELSAGPTGSRTPGMSSQNVNIGALVGIEAK